MMRLKLIPPLGLLLLCQITLSGVAPAVQIQVPPVPSPVPGAGPTASMIPPGSSPRPYRSPNLTFGSSRPIMAVGTLKSIDSATSTVVIAINRRLSCIPHIMVIRAQQAGKDKELFDKELPPQRTFHLTPRTMILDARPNPNKTPAKAVSGKLQNQDQELLKFSDFKPGDPVGVLYRMGFIPGEDPLPLNFCRLNPGQGIDVEASPLSDRYKFLLAQKRKRLAGRALGHDVQTSPPLSLDQPTTHGL